VVRIRLQIFKTALKLQPKVEFIGTGRDSMYYNVGDNKVEFRIQGNKTEITCDCTHSSIYVDGLCCHKIACIHFLISKLGEKKKWLN